ncbi:MAG: hypothetical protein IPM82_27970, partial [Saprospiraceae bacterium]|nr:hypothetical protein [Saprospiraceae bacterium]
ANEVKILSCQPSRFSLEGEQWGGGRGNCFSTTSWTGCSGWQTNADRTRSQSAD